MSGGETGIDRARQRRAARDASGEMYVDGSIYEGMEACLTRSGRTVAHVVKYADAVEIAGAMRAALPSTTAVAEMRDRIEELEQALRSVRADLLNEHGFNTHSIACTVWHGQSETTVDFIDAALDDSPQLPLAALPLSIGEGWCSMDSAPRDGSYFLALVAPERSGQFQYQAGRMFVIRHEGRTPSDYDLGWAVYPGFGGASDFDFTHWRPLPAPPAESPQG